MKFRTGVSSGLLLWSDGPQQTEGVTDFLAYGIKNGFMTLNTQQLQGERRSLASPQGYELHRVDTIYYCVTRNDMTGSDKFEDTNNQLRQSRCLKSTKELANCKGITEGFSLSEPIFRETVALVRVGLCQSRVLSFVFTLSAEEERVVGVVVLRNPTGTLRDFKLTCLKQVPSNVATAVRNWVR
ncbi:hypothetical protein J6590_093263 [Homalodisca vitripennis]|nr:hypothetical protein J6590_093263 [Homalodisca vitripennis]